jgi:F-type H+-transporting ATPase subunit a
MDSSMIALSQLPTPQVSILAQRLFNIGPVHVTNSMLYGLIGSTLTWGILIYASRQAKARHYNRLTVAVLWVYEYLLDTAAEVLGSMEAAHKLAPLAITMFFFIFINNVLEVLPIIGPLTYNGIPLFRGLAADLNFTFALAVITMVTAQIWAIRSRGFFGNLGRYFGNPFRDPMHAFEGFLELVAEFSRFIALSMRLFGNIFGGEVLLAVMAFITSYATPLTVPPFMLFELFIGLIQAYIFFMLTVVFVSLGTTSHDAPASSSDTYGLSGEVAT